MRRPDIYQFDDPVDYLNEFFLWKRGSPSFSLRAVSLRASIKSKSLLSMVLKRRRRLTMKIAGALALALDLSRSESRVLEILAKTSRLDKSDQEKSRASLDHKIFSPAHFFSQDGKTTTSTSCPPEVAEKLIDRSYALYGDEIVYGKKIKWTHTFYWCELTEQLKCRRSHGHPSKKSDEIRFYKKELIWQPISYLFIFWEEPLPQVHALPLSPAFFKGRRISVTSSGIIYEGNLIV